MGKLEQNHQVMMDQINTDKLEAIPNQPSGNQVHYISHHVVFKENSERTKLRIVYDCSSEESNDVPSFNDYLETGPPLQPKLSDILVRNRFKRFAITGDVLKAFLQVLTTGIEMYNVCTTYFVVKQPRKPINQRVSLL